MSISWAYFFHLICDTCSTSTVGSNWRVCICTWIKPAQIDSLDSNEYNHICFDSKIRKLQWRHPKTLHEVQTHHFLPTGSPVSRKRRTSATSTIDWPSTSTRSALWRLRTPGCVCASPSRRQRSAGSWRVWRPPMRRSWQMPARHWTRWPKSEHGCSWSWASCERTTRSWKPGIMFTVFARVCRSCWEKRLITLGLCPLILGP